MLRVSAIAAVLAVLSVQPVQAQVSMEMGPTDPIKEEITNGLREPEFELTASTPYTNFYHRTGATIDDHDQAVTACYSLAAAMDEPMGPYPNGMSADLNSVPNGYSAGGLLGVVVVAAIQGAIAENNAERREPVARLVNVENCMVSFGWDVRSVAPEEEARLRSLSAEDLRRELAPRVGAAEPTGHLLRTFGNEMAQPGFYRLGMPSSPDQPSLSLRLATLPDEDPDAARLGYRDARRVSDRWIRMMPDHGVVGVRLRAGPHQSLMAVRLVRMNDDGSRPASDGEPNSILVAFRDLPSQGGYDDTQYFEAPPGNWRFAEILHGDTVVSLCLAAPQFAIEEGEGVFAGTFDVTTAVMPAFVDAPAQVRDIVLRPAEYEQAGQTRCAGAYFYALRLPEA